MKKKDKTLIIIGVAAVVVVLLMKSQQSTQQPAQNNGGGLWGGLVNAIGNTMERGNDSITRMIQATYEEKRQNGREDYARLRDTKDNSAIFSNDMLIY